MDDTYPGCLSFLSRDMRIKAPCGKPKRPVLAREEVDGWVFPLALFVVPQRPSCASEGKSKVRSAHVIIRTKYLR